MLAMIDTNILFGNLCGTTICLSLTAMRNKSQKNQDKYFKAVQCMTTVRPCHLSDVLWTEQYYDLSDHEEFEEFHS